MCGGERIDTGVDNWRVMIRRLLATFFANENLASSR